MSGVEKSQNILSEVKVWTVASTATAKANQSIAERNQLEMRGSRNRLKPTRKTTRKVAHRTIADCVSKL